LVGERRALINQLRAILLERGFIAPQGRRKLERARPRIAGRVCLWVRDDTCGLTIRISSSLSCAVSENNAVDAEAIFDAAARPTMRFVR
jgi:hypothetical protein